MQRARFLYISLSSLFVYKQKLETVGVEGGGGDIRCKGRAAAALNKRGEMKRLETYTDRRIEAEPNFSLLKNAFLCFLNFWRVVRGGLQSC